MIWDMFEWEMREDVEDVLANFSARAHRYCIVWACVLENRKDESREYRGNRVIECGVVSLILLFATALAARSNAPELGGRKPWDFVSYDVLPNRGVIRSRTLRSSSALAAEIRLRREETAQVNMHSCFAPLRTNFHQG